MYHNFGRDLVWVSQAWKKKYPIANILDWCGRHGSMISECRTLILIRWTQARSDVNIWVSVSSKFNPLGFETSKKRGIFYQDFGSGPPRMGKKFDPFENIFILCRQALEKKIFHRLRP